MAANGGEAMMREVLSLRGRLGAVMLVMVCTVVTWGLIDTTRRVLFQPWLISVIGLDDSRIVLGHDQVADLGAFYSVVITWTVVMLLLGMIVIGWYAADNLR